MSSNEDTVSAADVAASAYRQASRLRALVAEAEQQSADRDADRVAFLARRWRGGRQAINR